jgi:hypothetical protein
MFVIEQLPRAGTPLRYRFGIGKTHKATIDSGIVFTQCGIQRKPNPNFDTFHLPKAIPEYAQCKNCYKYIRD